LKSFILLIFTTLLCTHAHAQSPAKYSTTVSGDAVGQLFLNNPADSDNPADSVNMSVDVEFQGHTLTLTLPMTSEIWQFELQTDTPQQITMCEIGQVNTPEKQCHKYSTYSGR
jgi:hypothetical protein